MIKAEETGEIIKAEARAGESMRLPRDVLPVSYKIQLIPR
jgi:hypothetical protein